MQNVLTNTPPVDSDLLKRKNVSKPRLVDVGKPRPAPKPVLVDVGKPKPAPKTKLVDVGKPKLPTIEQLVQQIDSDLNFVPSKSQIKEYFAYKDKQPFGFKKTWDATVNAVGTALGDMTKAVGSAVTDPDFYNPISKKKYATLAEGFARGSWDLATLGRMMTDKFQEVIGDPSERERVKYIVKRHNEEYPDDKVGFMQVFNRGNRDFKNPKDYNRYYSDFKDNLTEKRIERWRTMRYILNTRNLAREGKKTILGEFLGEKADKELLPHINQEVAEGSSYFLDLSLPVGLAATPLKAGQKSVVTRGITAPVLEKSGRRIKETGKWIDETIAKLETKAAENADIVEPAATVSSAVGGAVLAPESVGPVAGAVAGAIGGKYGLPKIGTVTKIGKPITIAGEGIEAIGKVIGKPETLESTLQQASRIAESESARNILKKAANLDPAITLVDNLAVGSIEGSKAGGILTLPSGDEEFIGGGFGTGGTMGGFGSVSGNVIGDKSRTQQQAKNTVEAWIESKSKDERKAIQDLRLSPIEAANVAMAELLGRGIIGDGKISDINFVYLSQPEYIKKIHPELMIDGKVPDVLPAGTRGAQSSVDGTPTVFINSGYDGPRSIFHEMMHAMLKFDEMSDNRTELRSVLFDQKTDDGTVLKEGMYSDGDIDVFFDQYLSRLPEEIRDSWEEQFNVLREEGAEKTLVTDKEATLDAKRQYIMEEVEAESFANFIKESGPTFLRGSRTIRQRIVDRFLLQDNLKKTRLLRAVLEKSGVPFGADGNPTGVFWKDGKPISNNRELNRVMRDFVRAKDSVTRRMMEDEGGETPSLSIGAKRKAEGRKKVEIALKSKDGKLLVSHFNNNDIFKRKKNGEIKYDALTGEPILLGEKEIQALQENRANQIQDALAANDDPSGMTAKESKVDGKISWSGIPSDAQLKAILNIPNDIIPPGMKDTITDIVGKMKTPGQSIIIDYNPAMGSGKRYSSNLSSGLRIAVPLGFHVSQSKNFYITTLDLGAMNIKLSDWGNPDSKTHKNLDLWNGDSKLFQQDMFKYLENHKNDRPGESGLDANPATAETKRNIINDFFGATAKDYNPITDARKASKRTGKQRKVENPIRSRRFDRINKIEKNRITKYGAGTPLPMKTQSDAYNKLKKNLMPGGGLRFMPDGRAKAGGEVGKNQEFYKGGQFLPSTEMPKREREKINRAASGKERIDVGYGSDKFAIPEVYKAPLVRDYSVFMNDKHMDYLLRENASPEYIEKQKEAKKRWEAGDRFIDIREKPEFAKFQDVARIFKAGLPIPDQVVKALEASGNVNIETIKKYSSKTESGDTRFMPGQPQASVRPPVDDLGFFSRVEQVAMGDKIPNRGSGDQMLATIKKQPGVKQEELQWLGLEDYLRGKKQVTKQELTDFIRENDIQLEETILSGDRYDSYDPDKKTSPTRYEEYQLPGAEDGSYKEMLLRLPKKYMTFEEYATASGQELGSFFARKDYDAYLKDLRPQYGDSHPVNPRWVNFRSSHWQEPNILAHVRFNDRTGPNGEKILFVEELQSDWHSEGRKSGYKIEKVPTKPDGLPEGYEVRRQKNNAGEFFGDKYAVVKEGENLVTPYVFTKEKAREWAINYFKDNQPVAGVPDAPFKSSWHELATKRMLRYAAENGYDKLAFIDGQSTADRYDLSKKISEVSYNEGSKTLMAKDKSGKSVLLEDGVSPEKIANYIGKEPAEKLLNQPLDEMQPGAEDVTWRTLEGEDLKVGGEWASNLYDRMIPQFLKKYGKKFGAKVEDVVIDAGIPEPYKAIDITPQMRGEDGVMGGQVRFMPGVSNADAFNSAKKNHGLTRNIEEAGYVLPNGELLDFSGRHWSGEYSLKDDYWKLKPKYDRDYMVGQRDVDHRDIEYDGVPTDEQWSGMVDFMKRGAVRVDAKAGMISVHGRTPLTKQQENRVREISDLKDGEIYLDAEDDTGKQLSLVYDVSNSKRIIGDLRRWARGDEPESGVRFTPSTPGTRTPTQSTPTSQPVNLVMDKIYRLPDEEKEERKDRAMEILKQFSKP